MLVECFIVAGYLLILMAAGFTFRRMNSNVDDYFRTGCKGTWWLIGVGVFMGQTGAGTFVAAAGLQYEAGFTTLAYGALAVLAWAMMAIPAAWFRQTRCITIPEMIEKRFDTPLQQFYAVMSVLFGIIGSAIQLWAVAVFCSSMFGYNIFVTIIAIGCVMVLLSTVGGIWAVMGTAFIQGVVLVPIVFLLSILSWCAVGGWDGFIGYFDKIPDLKQQWALVKADGVFPGNKYTSSWLFAMALLLLPQAFSMGTAPRFFSVKDGREARKTQLLATILYAPTVVLWCLPAFAARFLYSEKVMSADLSKPAESAFAIASMNVLPKGVSMLVVVTIFTAGMSSLCTALNQNAAMLTQDVYPFFCRLFHRNIKEGLAKLVFAKISTAVSGAVLILIALYFSMQKSMGVFEVMMQVAALLYTPMAAPLFLGMLIKRTPRWAPFFAITCGFLVSIASVVSEKLGHPWTFAQLVISVWCVSHGAFLITIPFFKWSSDEYKKKVNNFFATMHTPIKFDQEIGKSDDISQLKITGLFTAIIGLLISTISFLADDWKGRVSVLSVSAVILGVGLVLLYIGQKNKCSQKRSTGNSVSQPALSGIK